MKRNLYFLIFFISFLFPSGIIYSNTNDPNWQTIFLTPGGGNVMDGVEAYFQLGTCNGEDVVFVKFINHNEYSVRLEWFDAVFTQELRWINKDDEANKKSFLIPAKTEASGACEKAEQAELIITLKKFVPGKNEFKRYSAFRLNVLAVQ